MIFSPDCVETGVYTEVLPVRVSSRGEYALLALVELAEHNQDGPVKIKHIAERQNIPKKYLEQVLLALKRGGLVTSTRGKHGGYHLDHSPSEISVLDVLELLEEQFTLVDNSRERPVYLETFWDQTTREIREQLDVPLTELLQRKEQEQDSPMYHI